MSFHPEKINQKAISAACETITTEFAKGTDTPFDDWAATQTAEAIAVLLNRLLGPQPMMAGDSGNSEIIAEVSFGANREDKAAKIRNLAESMGVSISPTLLALLLQFGPSVIEIILNRLRK